MLQNTNTLYLLFSLEENAFLGWFLIDNTQYIFRSMAAQVVSSRMPFLFIELNSQDYRAKGLKKWD